MGRNHLADDVTVDGWGPYRVLIIARRPLIRAFSRLLQPVGIAAALIGLALYGLCRIFFNAVVIRFWSPSDLADIVEPMAVGGLFAAVALPAFASALGRYPAQAKDVVQGATAARFLLKAMATFLVAGVVVTWSALVVGGGQPVPVAGFATTYGASTVAVGATRYLYFWSGRLRSYLLGEALSWTLFAGIVAIALALGSKALMAFSWLAQGIVFVGASWYAHRDVLAHRSRRWEPPWSGNRELVSFGLINVLGSLPSMATPQLALLAVAILGSRSDVGYWAALVSLISPLQLLPRAVATVSLPRLASQRSRGHEALRWELERSTRVLTLLAFSGAAPLSAAASAVLLVTIGLSSADLELAWALLLLSQAMTVGATPVVSALSSGPLRQVAIPAAASALGLVATCAAWVGLHPLIGLPGIAAGILAGTLVRTLLPLGYGARRHWFAPSQLVEVAAGTCLVLAGAYLGKLSPGFGIPIALALCAGLLARARRSLRPNS
jgi:O-antigen/teichoic acid export membrane protein